VKYLKDHGVGVEVYYPLCLHQQECFEYLGYRNNDFPVSEEAAATVLALPIFPEITETQQARVIQACNEYLTQSLRKAA
jgi:dTDP-4-amino-4,6-dideoxygalactose transaminase